MTGITLAPWLGWAVSVAAGLSIGAAATVGATLLAQGGSMAPTQGVPTPAVSTMVQYGDRCIHDYCPPLCGTTTDCLDAVLPPDNRSRKP